MGISRDLTARLMAGLSDGRAVEQVGSCNDRDADSIAEFCRRNGICRATFYKLLAKGQGPRIMKVGARTLISREAASDWRRRMEVDAAG